MQIAEIVKICIPQESSKYYDPNGIELHADDWCIVESKYNADVGKVLWKYKIPDLPAATAAQAGGKKLNSMPKVLRKATDKECKLAEENRIKERQAFKICLQKIAYQNLAMKLSKVKYTLDGDRIIFYFTSERRIDFRYLAKDLARTFRKRIELIKIGVRDEAALIGGCGHCGRPLCCTTFIRDFQSVAIRMAKNQDMSLAPEKISGVCGRLLCCLRFENDWYSQVKGRMPQIGDRVSTPRGLGVVDAVNLFKEKVRVRLNRGDLVELDTIEIRPPRRKNVKRKT